MRSWGSTDRPYDTGRDILNYALDRLAAWRVAPAGRKPEDLAGTIQDLLERSDRGA